jgi:hypothetical protein
MKDNIARGVASISFLAVCTSALMASQEAPGAAQTPTIRVQSSLVLVDVISQDPKSGLPVRDFKKEDFRLLITGTKSGLPLLTPGPGTTRGPLLFGLW